MQKITPVKKYEIERDEMIFTLAATKNVEKN
jgi:endonuclease I